MAVVIFICLVVMSLYGYVFNQNPIGNSNLTNILESGLTITAKDNCDHVLLEVGAKPDNVVSYSDISPDVLNAVSAVNFILNGSRAACSPQLSPTQQIANKCQYVYTDIITKEYVLNHLIQANLSLHDKNDDLFYKLKHFLVTTWLKKHFTLQDFMTFFLNYSYYGNSVIGIRNAASKIFGKDLKEMNLADSIHAVMMLVQNNNYIYSDPKYLNLVTFDNILHTMYILGYINEAQMNKARHTKVYLHTLGVTTPYQIYANSTITVALPRTAESNLLQVNSTINNGLQATTAASAINILLSDNISNFSAYVVHEGKIATGYTINNEKGVISYASRYPMVAAKFALRPLSYLALYSKGVNLPASITGVSTQNIIVKQLLSPESLVSDYFPAANHNNSSHNYNQQTEALKELAKQLTNIETNLISKVSFADMSSLLSNLFFPPNSLYGSVGSYYAVTPLNILIDSFAILNQKGVLYHTIFIHDINGENLKPATPERARVNVKDIQKLFKGVIIYQSMRFSGDASADYYIIPDKNLVIGYYRDYTFGMWFGNMNISPIENLETNYYKHLQSLVPSMIQALRSADAEYLLHIKNKAEKKRVESLKKQSATKATKDNKKDKKKLTNNTKHPVKHNS